MSWLDQLERELDARLSAFLRSNPNQERLFQDQHLKDRAEALKRQRIQLQAEADVQRQQLLDLAADVRAWRDRMNRAKGAGAADLAARASNHLDGLMQQGRHLWSDLDDLGRRFSEVDQQLARLSEKEAKASRPADLDKDWAVFEAEQELKDLRRRHGLDP
jgi:hercynine metabolism protein